MSNSEQLIYKVIFTQQDSVHELYARSIGEDDLLGFIQVDEIVFSDNAGVFADSFEEQIKQNKVITVLLPLHAILRIDIVARDYPVNFSDSKTNVRRLPSSGWSREKK